MVFLAISVLWLYPFQKLHLKAGLPQGGRMAIAVPGFTWIHHGTQKWEHVLSQSTLRKVSMHFYFS